MTSSVMLVNIIINYDFWEHILDVQEGITTFKIVRNNKRKWARWHFPIYTLVDALILESLDKTILCLVMQFGGLTAVEYMAQRYYDDDLYAKIAKKDLTFLAQKLNDNHIKTSYPLLLDSKYYDKEWQIHINENKLPEWIEKKYILVPTYAGDGDIHSVSMVQNHVVGSDSYVLTLGSPKKSVKPILAKGV